MDLAAYGLVPHHKKNVQVGDRFGRLTILAMGKLPGTYRYMAICKCDCGSEAKPIRMDGITKGLVTSCGCFQKEQTSTHGLTNHPLYSRHHLMMSRCYDPTDAAYANYGKRGISVCDRWHDVRLFVQDLGPLHSPGLEMDRINNDGNYEPLNVRFVTRQQNCDNRRSVRSITYKGKTQSLQAWATELGIHYKTLWTRIAVWEWDTEKAFSTPALNDKERMAIARAVRWGQLATRKVRQ